MAKITFWEGTDNPDTFSNGSSSDITLISSKAGNDTLINWKGGVYIDAGTDNNVVSLAAVSNNSVIAHDGNDIINVQTSKENSYYNYIRDSGGNNLINNGNIQHSTIYAGAGADTITSGGWYTSIDAGDGNNVITIVDAVGGNTILAGEGDNAVSIAGNSSSDYIKLGEGNNTVKGGLGGNNKVIAGDGQTNVTIGGGLVSLGSGEGNAVSLLGGYNNSSVISGNGNDTINVEASEGDNYYNVMSISGGNNIINNGNIQHSTISAGAGDDTITSGSWYTSIDAGDGDNSITLVQSSGGNSVYAGSGNDYASIAGSSGSNYVNVGAGDNTVVGGLGSGNSIIAGKGNNRVSIGGGLVSLGSGDGNEVSLRSYNNSSIISGDGDDTINVASIEGNSYYSFISISGGNNLINNGNIQHSTIYASAGADSITSGGWYTSIDAGDGDNSITLVQSSGGNSVYAGSGNDYASIAGSSGSNYVNVGAGDNTVVGGLGSGNSIIAGKGNNRVSIGGGLVSLGSGDGNEVSLRSYNNSSIISGDGDDTINVASIEGNSYYSFISISGGNNIINNGNIQHSTIYAGAGADSITSGGWYTSIDAGDGNNVITIVDAVGGNTILAGEGDNAVSITGNSGSDYIRLGEGNNTVKGGLGGNNKVIAGDGQTNVTIGGGLVSLGSGEGNAVSLLGGYNNSSVISGNGNDTINVEASEGNNYYNFISISGGNNLINNSNIQHSTIYAGAGADSITSGGWYTSIDAGDGNNIITIVDAGSGNTILAGEGDNAVSITGNSGSDYIRLGEGNNTVKGGLGGNNKVIAGDGQTNVTIGGGLVSLGSGEGNAVSLLGGYNNSSVISGNGNDTINVEASEGNNYYNFISISGGNNLINNSNIQHSTISAGDGNDIIISAGWYTSINAGDGNNKITINGTQGGNTIITGAGKDTITFESDNGDNVISLGGGQNLIKNWASSNTLKIDGVIAATVMNDDVIVASETTIATLQGAKDFSLVKIDSVAASVEKTLGITKATSSAVSLAADFKNADASTRSTKIEITGNALDNLIRGGKGNDTLTGATGNDTLTGGKGKNIFVYSGGADVITDYKAKDKINTGSLAYTDFTLDGKDLIFNFDSANSLTIQGGAGKIVNMNSDSNFYTTAGVLDQKKKSIKLSATTEKFIADSKVETIDGSATGAIEITGNKKKNYIMAGANGATLNGDKGNDTLVGGDGADVFIYENKSGKDVIEGFSAGDLISLDSKVEIKDANTKKGDTILKFKGGSLTVKGTTEFNIGDTLYSGGIFIAGDTAKIYGSYNKQINLADSVKNFNGSLGKKKLKITGNAEANSLIGGKGNDKLWGGAGADTFIYQSGNGKDTIMDYDFAQGDLLQILDKKGKEGDFKKATFKKNTFMLAIDGGGKVSFSGVTSDTSININGSTKTISDWTK